MTDLFEGAITMSTSSSNHPHPADPHASHAHSHAHAAPTTASANPTVMERLRDSTTDHHTAAEQHPFQKSLAMGTLPREQYVANLGQLLHVHRALESALRAAALAGATDPAVKAAITRVVKDYQHQEAYLIADLKFFGVDPATVAPLAATAKFVSHVQSLAARAPIALLGMQYVLEGSNNGSKFLSKIVLRAYGLEPGDGTRYMDPYGARQREYWAAFKADMNAETFTAAQIEQMVEAARWTFEAIEKIGGEIQAGQR